MLRAPSAGRLVFTTSVHDVWWDDTSNNDLDGLRIDDEHALRSPRSLLTHMVSAITAFWTWRRFSAWSKTRLCGPSITSSVTSMLRSAGSGCM